MHNNIEAMKWNSREKEQYRKEEKTSLLDKCTLGFQRVVTNHGSDWLRGLIWIVLFNGIVTSIFVLYGSLCILYPIILGLVMVILCFYLKEDRSYYVGLLVSTIILYGGLYFVVDKEWSSSIILELTVWFMDPLHNIRTLDEESAIRKIMSNFIVLDFFIRVINITLYYLEVSAFRQMSRTK